MIGLCNKKLAEVLLKEAGIDLHIPSKKSTGKTIDTSDKTAERPACRHHRKQRYRAGTGLCGRCGHTRDRCSQHDVKINSGTVFRRRSR